jgi:hypothetical protein
MPYRKARPVRKDGSVKCGWPKGEWPHCSVCDGRIHEPGCTAKMRPAVDCCPARHKTLHDQGQTKGVNDSLGWHPNDPAALRPKGL